MTTPLIASAPNSGVPILDRRRPANQQPTRGVDPLKDVTSSTGFKPSAEERRGDAYFSMLATLQQYGLESLADFVWQQIVEGRSGAEIERDIRNTPEFKARFPAIEERTKRGLSPLSPGEYVAYEQQARQIMRAAGLPESFYDTNEDFNAFLSGDVSISELNDRIQLGRQMMYEEPQEVRDALALDYGMTEGDMVAFMLDKKRALPLIEQRVKAAQIGGAGRRTGFNSTREENERLVALGVTAERAQEGFGALQSNRELFTPLDRGEDEISREEQLGAVFGTNPAAQRRIEQRKRKRLAAFEGGGGFAAGQGGVAGLGGID